MRSELKLEEATFFRALQPEQLVRVRPLLTERRFERGRDLFFAGEPASHLWTVGRGNIRLYKSSSDGRVTTLETLRAGEIFGALSVTDQGDYPVSAEGMNDGMAWCLPRAALVRLLEEDPRLNAEILQVVSSRLQDAQERLRSFAHDSAPCRLAQALLRAADDGEAWVTRRDLAEAAGTSVETAIRVLRSFQRDQIIDGKVGHVAVLNESALQAIASAVKHR